MTENTRMAERYARRISDALWDEHLRSNGALPDTTGLLVVASEMWDEIQSESACKLITNKGLAMFAERVAKDGHES